MPKTYKSGTGRIVFTVLKFLKDYGSFINVPVDESLIDPRLKTIELLVCPIDAYEVVENILITF
jgi:hypothetical protein